MRNIIIARNELRERRKDRTRAKIFGTSIRPRLSIFRSLKHLAVQAIDDEQGKTISSAYDREAKAKTRQEKSKELGQLIAKKLLEKKIDCVVFDKGHYKYHGLVKAIADGAREAGLKF